MSGVTGPVSGRRVALRVEREGREFRLELVTAA